jgi:DNA-directed RNA polymerase subunit omega
MVKNKVYSVKGSMESDFHYQGKIMARITVEDCLKKVNNRFALIHMAAKRVRQLRKGAEPTVASKNRDVVVALREIAAGSVAALDVAEQDKLLEEKTDILVQELEGDLEQGQEKALDQEEDKRADV